MALLTTQQKINALQDKITKINKDKSDLTKTWGTQLKALEDTLGLNQRETAFYRKELKKYHDLYYTAKGLILQLSKGYSGCAGSYDFSTFTPPSDNPYGTKCDNTATWTSRAKLYRPYVIKNEKGFNLWNQRMNDSNKEIADKTDIFNDKIDVFNFQKDEFEQDIKDIISADAAAQKILDQEKLAAAAAEAMTDPEIIKATKEAEIAKKKLEEESKRKRMSTIIWAVVAVVVGIAIVIAVKRG